MSGVFPASLDAGRARRLVLVVALVLFTWNIWGYDLWAPDEPFFGEGAREMIVDGEWLVPHVNGEVNSHKPPLFFWLIALVSWPFGAVSSATARLPSALAALVTVATTMTMVRRAADGRAAALAGAVLATSFLFWEKARTAQIDSLLCCLITLALFAFSEYRAGRLSGRAAGIAFWAACALGTLAKGPVGLLLPLGTALLVLAAERGLRSWRGFAPLSGPLVFVAIAGLWVGSLQLWPVEGYSVLGALREHFVERGLSGMDHLRPWWYYAKVVPWTFFPWSLLLPGALVFGWRQRSDPAVRLAFVHTLFVVLFFSISAEKRELYILPALPAMATLVALFVDSRLAAPAAAPALGMSRRWLFVPLLIVGGLMILVGVAVPILARWKYPQLLAGGFAVGALFVGGGSWIARAAWQERGAHAVRNTVVAMAVVLVGIASGYPAMNSEKSGRELAGEVQRAVEAAGSPPVSVVAFDISNIVRPINFYGGGLYARTLEGEETATLLSLLGSGEPLVLVADRSSLPDLDAGTRARMVELYATRQSRRDVVVFRVEGRR